MAECSQSSTHDNHMCQLVARKEMDAVKEKATAAQYICMNCGRAAKCETDVCNPSKL